MRELMYCWGGLVILAGLGICIASAVNWFDADLKLGVLLALVGFATVFLARFFPPANQN